MREKELIKKTEMTQTYETERQKLRAREKQRLKVWASTGFLILFLGSYKVLICILPLDSKRYPRILTK